MTQYEMQLLSVEQALVNAGSEDERQELLSLKENLIELLALTQYEAEQQSSERPSNAKEDIDDEIQKFMNEIKEIEYSSEELQQIKEKYEAMIGEKCRAPHKHTWGAIAYHNALICGIEDEASIDGDGHVDVTFRILFTNPTHREMVPCSYYLDGECRFNDSNCHYSHGELVSAADILDYVPPDFSRLSRNCSVLAKTDDRLWHRGRVVCVNFVEKECRVRLEGTSAKTKEKDFIFEDLFPLSQGDEDETSSDSDSEVGYSENPLLHDECNFAETFTYQSSQPLGEWEKYTRGIGSKLMAKMGYIYGQGLGTKGCGIVTPVSAQILPPGRSLDHCMELREAANGDKNLFSAERKLQRDKKIQEKISAKAYENETKRLDVFSFLNNNILTPNRQSEVPVSSKTSLQSHTLKSLNVESVKVEGDIRRKEREIGEIQKSIKRNASGSQEVCNRLQQTLKVRTSELNALQMTQKSLTHEQATRKTKEKLCVF